MAKRKFTEAEIIAALKRAESGLTYERVGREMGVSKHHRLCVEVEVRRDERERGAAAAAVGT